MRVPSPASIGNDFSPMKEEPDRQTPKSPFRSICDIFTEDYPSTIRTIENCAALEHTENHFICSVLRNRLEKRRESLGECFSFVLPIEKAEANYNLDHTRDQAQRVLERERAAYKHFIFNLGIGDPDIYYPDYIKHDERSAESSLYRDIDDYLGEMEALMKKVVVCNSYTREIVASIKIYMDNRRKRLGILVHNGRRDLIDEVIERFCEKFIWREAIEHAKAVRERLEEFEWALYPIDRS